MSRILIAIALFFNAISCVAAQTIPLELRGKWRVHKILPAETVSCWGDKEGKALIGTEIEYAADSFRWKDKSVPHPRVEIAVVAADEFQKEYWGSGSFVDFHHLGIRTPQATEVQIGHPPADTTGGSIEIPGDRVLIKDQNTIVFSVCNVYFEGKREREPAQKKTLTH